jgi:Fe-S-cluster containining protein
MTASFTVPPVQNFSCSGCGDCCRDLPVPLSEADIKTLEKLEWKPLVAEAYQDRFHETISLLGRDSITILRSRPGGAGCVFLGDDNLCAIHRELGSEKKPFACRVFPFQFVEYPHQGTQSFVSPQFFCKSVAEGSGDLVKDQEADLKILNKQQDKHFPEAAIRSTLAFTPEVDYKVPLLDQLNRILAKTIDQTALPFSKRLLIATRFADIVLASKFKTLDHPKRMDFIETLYKGTVNHVEQEKVLVPTAPPNFPERVMFSQILGFRTLNHKPTFLGQGVKALAGASASRFFHVLWWMLGWGKITWPWPPEGRTVSLGQILSAAPKSSIDDPAATAALTRYFSAAFHGRKLFEINLRKRSFIPGLGLLLRQVPAIMLFARASALSRESNEITDEDYTRALRLADLSFGHFPYVAGMLGSVRRKALMDLRGPWFHLPWVCN